jgi:Transposase
MTTERLPSRGQNPRNEASVKPSLAQAPLGPRAAVNTTSAKGGWMDETEVRQIEAWAGLEVGKEDHHATVLSAAGEPLLELAVSNDEAAIERLLDRALEVGPCALVIDQPGSIGSLTVCLARRRGVPVAYVPGLVMRRALELYPGEAKTDRRDSFVLADTARTHARRLHWLEASDETLDRLRLLGGYDDDLAHDVNRTANRLRDMLLAVSPALERVLGPRLDHPAARALLARYHTPTALRAAGPRRLTPLAKRHAPSLGRPARRRGPGCARRPDRHRPRRGDSRPGHPRARRRARPTGRPARPARPGDRADLHRPPSGAGPDVDPGNRGQDRRTDPHRDR